MPKIRVDRDLPIINGQTLTFQSPANCSDITGLVIYYPEGDTTKSKDFKLVDAHGVDVGSGTISLFAANALVKVVLDIDQGKAFVQNADTNAYLEGKLAEKYSPNNKPSPADIGAAKIQAPNDMLHNGNEYTFIPDNYYGEVYINHRAGGGDHNGQISNYHFCNGSAFRLNKFLLNTFTGTICSNGLTSSARIILPTTLPISAFA